RGAADHCAVFLHAEDLHRGNLDDGHQGLKSAPSGRLPKIGRYRMGGSRAATRAIRKLQAEFAFFIGPVQYHHGDALVGIPKRRDLEVLPRTRAEDPGGTGPNEAAEVSKVIIRTLENESVVHCVR